MKRTLMIAILLCFTLCASSVKASNKYALVIGNRLYEEAPLRNPENDANDMADQLEQFGFSVMKKINIRHQDMENAIRDFGKLIQAGDTALFYFSGHGIQVDGVNYLLPIGTTIDSVDEIKYKAVNANMVLDKLEQAGSDVNIIILDACRNNPFSRFRSLQRGLALMTSPSGTLIAYATSPGNVAYDGDERNSPYTKHLLNAMQTPGLQIEEVFKDVRVSVMAETANKQVPWESSSLTGEFYFTPISSSLQSIEEYRRHLEIHPNDSATRFQLALAYEKANNAKDAITQYTIILTQSPDAKTATLTKNQLAWLYAKQEENLEEALTLVLEAEQESPSAGVIDTVGWVYYKRGEYQKALEKFGQALALSPNQPTIKYHIGLTYMKQGNNEMAIQEFEESLKISSDFPEAKKAQHYIEKLSRSSNYE